MRAISPIKLLILSGLLMITAFLVNSQFVKSAEIISKEPLQLVFDKVGPNRCVRDFPMDASISDALKLDDYLFKSYATEQGLVNLYIGYYRTAKKVGAAHDPLVCFSGQGWQIKSRESGEYTLKRDPSLKIIYSTMIAERQGEREFVLYWFQTRDKASANTQSQKMAMVMDRLSGKSEDNAFVRLNAAIGEESPDVVHKRMLNFMEDFYPDFYRYVTKN